MVYTKYKIKHPVAVILSNSHRLIDMDRDEEREREREREGQRRTRIAFQKGVEGAEN